MFSNLPTPQVEAVLDLLEPHQIELISDKHFSELNFDPTLVNKLFDQVTPENKRRFALLQCNSERAQNFYANLTRDRKALFSGSQLPLLDYSKLTYPDICNLFPGAKAEENERFAHLSEGQVKQILDMVSPNYFNSLPNISDKQLNEIDLEGLTNKQLEKVLNPNIRERIENLSKDRILPLLKKENITELLHVFSDRKLKEVGVENFSNVQLAQAYGHCMYRSFELFTDEEVALVVNKLIKEKSLVARIFPIESIERILANSKIDWSNNSLLKYSFLEAKKKKEQGA